MSTYWNIHCLDCGADSEDMGNRVDDALKECIAFYWRWRIFRSAIGDPRRFDARFDFSGDFEGFMRKHCDHRLALRSEYYSDVVRNPRDEIVIGDGCEHTSGEGSYDYCSRCGLSAMAAASSMAKA